MTEPNNDVNLKMEFSLKVDKDDILRFKFVCVETDKPIIQAAFYNAFTSDEIKHEDKMMLLFSISDALIALLEQEQDNTYANITLEKFKELYNSSDTNF